MSFPRFIPLRKYAVPAGLYNSAGEARRLIAMFKDKPGQSALLSLARDARVLALRSPRMRIQPCNAHGGGTVQKQETKGSTAQVGRNLDSAA